MSAASFLCLSWCPHVYLFLSRSSPQRAPDWRVVQGWKAQWRGIQKQTTQKYTWEDGKDTVKHAHTHTSMRTQKSKRNPLGLSPAWHWTLQGRQHLLTSIFNTAKKEEHCVLEKLFIFTLCECRTKYSHANRFNPPQTSRFRCPGGYRKFPSAPRHSHCD